MSEAMERDSRISLAPVFLKRETGAFSVRPSARRKKPANDLIKSFAGFRPLKNRGDWIRTSGLYVPNVALYQTEPHLDC